MLVTVTGFGSIWRRRFGDDPTDSKRFARGAYFNTTGVTVRGSMRTRTTIAGYARFNGVGGFDPNAPLRVLNRVFECSEPCVWNGQNKILFRRMLSTPEQPDLFMIVIKACEVGHIDLGSEDWRSNGTLLISFSECQDQQEAMLLMPPGSWLRTGVGRYSLRPFVCWPWSARLQLETMNEDV